MESKPLCCEGRLLFTIMDAMKRVVASTFHPLCAVSDQRNDRGAMTCWFRNIPLVQQSILASVYSHIHYASNLVRARVRRASASIALAACTGLCQPEDGIIRLIQWNSPNVIANICLICCVAPTVLLKLHVSLFWDAGIVGIQGYDIQGNVNVLVMCDRWDVTVVATRNVSERKIRFGKSTERNVARCKSAAASSS